MQIILELDDCSIRVYRSFAEHIQYSSSFSYNYLIPALNHCYQVGQYIKHHAQKKPKILKLCLRVSYNSGIILSKMFTYYSPNYAGIIGAGLLIIINALILMSAHVTVICLQNKLHMQKSSYINENFAKHQDILIEQSILQIRKLLHKNILHNYIQQIMLMLCA